MQPSLRRISWNYSLVHALYYPALCPIASFSSVYLLDKGFSNGQIGLVLGISCVLVALLQPILAALADRSRRFDLSRILLSVIGVTMLALIGLIFCGKSLLLISFLYMLGTAGVWVLTPLINALCVWFVNRGVPVSFGLARGIGALTFAFVSAALGKLVEATSPDILPYVSLVFFLATGISVYAMRVGKYIGAEAQDAFTADTPKGGMAAFIGRYRLFCAGLIGWTMLFMFFRILLNYLYQIVGSIGGGSANLGVCFSIAAVAEMITLFSYNRLRRRISNASLMRFSAAAFVIQATITLLAPTVWVLYIGMGLQAFSSGVYFATSVYYANSIMQGGDKSKGQAMMTIVDAIASVCAFLIGGWLLSVSTVKILLITALSLAIAGAVIVLLTTKSEKKGVVRSAALSTES